MSWEQNAQIDPSSGSRGGLVFEIHVWHLSLTPVRFLPLSYSLVPAPGKLQGPSFNPCHLLSVLQPEQRERGDRETPLLTPLPQGLASAAGRWGPKRQADVPPPRKSPPSRIREGSPCPWLPRSRVSACPAGRGEAGRAAPTHGLCFLPRACFPAGCLPGWSGDFGVAFALIPPFSLGAGQWQRRPLWCWKRAFPSAEGKKSNCLAYSHQHNRAKWADGTLPA